MLKKRAKDQNKSHVAQSDRQAHEKDAPTHWHPSEAGKFRHSVSALLLAEWLKHSGPPKQGPARM